MRLYFIRHGQSTNNELFDRSGSDDLRNIDAPLTERGHRQALLLAEYLASPPSLASGSPGEGKESKDLTGFGITHIYCSLMDRAIATASYVAQRLSIPLEARDDIHECGGIWELDPDTGERRGLPGRNREALLAAYPALLVPESVGNDGWWNRPYEETSNRRDRAARALSKLLNRHGGTDDRVALVSHGDFFNWFAACALGIADTESLWLNKNNTSITRFDFLETRVVLQYLNRTEHLAEDLIT